MKVAGLLLAASLLLSVAAWGQSERTKAPKSRATPQAGVHKMPRHAARQFSMQEKQERAQLRAEHRREAKLAKKQRKQALRRTRKMEKTVGVRSQ